VQRRLKPAETPHFGPQAPLHGALFGSPVDLVAQRLHRWAVSTQRDFHRKGYFTLQRAADCTEVEKAPPGRGFSPCVKAKLKFLKMANLKYSSSNVRFGSWPLLLKLIQICEHTDPALLAQPVALAADVDGRRVTQ
jgi:hypothetical protein